MRPTLVVPVLVLAAALIAFVPRLGDGGPHPPDPGHEETIPAAVALAYARTAQLGRDQEACTVVAGDLARDFRCGSEDARVRSCGRIKLEDTLINDYSANEAEIDIGPCTIRLIGSLTGEWRVIEVTLD